MEEQKFLVVYHNNCIDGITSAATTVSGLIERKGKNANNIVVHPANYTDNLSDLLLAIEEYKITDVYIVDFSFTIADLKEIYSRIPGGVTVLDHHESAFRNLVDKNYEIKSDSYEDFFLHSDNCLLDIRVILNNDESGASLCYKHFFYKEGQYDDSKLPSLIKFVKDYDLYRFKYPETKAINKYLKHMKKGIETFVAAIKMFEDGKIIKRAILKGYTLLEYEEYLEAQLIEQGMTPIILDGITGFCVNAPYAFASSIGNKLAEKSGTFGAVWYQAVGGQVNFSLRSIGDSCNVSQLAEKFNGGGHKNAAGFTLKAPSYDKEKGIILWSNVEIPELETVG